MRLPPRLRAPFAAAAATALAPALFAQDDCATAMPVTVGVFAFDTTAAADEGPAFTCSSGAAFDLWFAYVAAADGDATFELCGSTFDTRLEIHTDCLGTVVACNDDLCGLQSFITMPVVGGTTYLIRVAGWNGATGMGTLTVTGPVLPDECATAEEIVLDTPTAFDTIVATPSLDVWTDTTRLVNDVWFTFTPTVDYMADILTCNMADFDTRLELYSGACGALVSEANNDNGLACLANTSEILGFPVLTGVQYWVRVGGFDGLSLGTGDLLVTGPPPTVANDECIGAIELMDGVSELFDNSMATNSTAAPLWSCGGSATSALDIWYTFSPLADSAVTVDTFGSSFDTRLEVYEGDCGTLVSLDCNDDSGGGLQSSVSFMGVGGATYYARVAGFGFGSSSGMGQITASFFGALPNDDCAGAIPVGLGMSTGTNVGATGSGVMMDCNASGGDNDVWFSYAALSSSSVTIDLSGSSFDTVLQVFDGDDCAALASLACDDDGGTDLASLVTFAALEGTTYLFHIGGSNRASGEIVMNLSEETGLGSQICKGVPNTTGLGAAMEIDGSLAVADNNLIINVTDLPLSVLGFVIHSPDQFFVANPGGSAGDLCIASFEIGRFNGDVLNSGLTGSVSFTPDLNAFPSVSGTFAVVVGETRNFQYWYRDVAASSTSNLSSAQSVVFK